MFSSSVRRSNRLWESLSQKERGGVLYDAGLLDEVPANAVMSSARIDEFLSTTDSLSEQELERFKQRALSIWNREKIIHEASDTFLRNPDEGFTDRVIITLGQSNAPMKSRAVSGVLSDTGAPAKNTRNLLSQLKKSGAVEELVFEESGDTVFTLTQEGLLRRDQLLGLD